MWEKLEEINRHYQELEEKMASPEVLVDLPQLQSLARQRSSIEEIVGLYREYRVTMSQLEETRAMLGDGLDKEMASLVREEVTSLEQKQERLKDSITVALLPRDPNDDKEIIMEIRAGTGGEEAGLFAGDLFRMYGRYAQNKGWGVEVISSSEAGSGGYKEIIFEINGKGAFSKLKYERGVHRVQRVPVTEASGRIHTSTVTVAVLPKVEEVDVDINPDDLRTDIFHSGGAGGQNVNKVATAVRITHLPTGIVVTCQDERSQLRNRQKAMEVMRSRLYEIQRSKQEEEMTQERRSQVGSGERAEKIRTYNFPQDRITDHRFGLTFHNLPKLLSGEIDDLIEALATNDQARKLQEGNES